MARKGENIHKRKDGRWEGRYKNGFTKSGKTKYSSVYGKSYTEVKNKLTTVKSKIISFDNNVYIERKFSEILIIWLHSNLIRIKKSTESKYRYLIDKHIIPSLGHKRISMINASVINDFLYNKLQSGRLNGKGGLSPAYVKLMAIIIESSIKYAADEGMCAPLKSAVLKPTITKKEMHILSVSAQQHFENSATTSINETTIGIFIALHSGLRIGEVCALSWDDIDFDTQIIHVRHTVTRVLADKNSPYKTMLIIDVPKTKASIRDVPITSALFPLLKTMKAISNSKYVISTNTEFVSTRTYDYRYKKVLRDYGIPIINFHALRHTFATRCVEVGIDVKSLSQMLGHANVSTTLNTYVHPSLDVMKIQIEKLSTLSICN